MRERERVHVCTKERENSVQERLREDMRESDCEYKRVCTNVPHSVCKLFNKQKFGYIRE